MALILDNELRSADYNVDVSIDNAIHKNASMSLFAQGPVDPLDLEDLFAQMISQLKFQLVDVDRSLLEMRENCSKKRANLRSILFSDSNGLENSSTMRELDGEINSVVTKILHMGNQLETRTGPRDCLFDARTAMEELNQMMTKYDQGSSADSLASIGTAFDELESGASIGKILLAATGAFSSNGNDILSQLRKPVEQRVARVQEELFERFTRAMHESDPTGMRRTNRFLDPANRRRAHETFITFHLQVPQKLPSTKYRAVFDTFLSQYTSAFMLATKTFESTTAVEVSVMDAMLDRFLTQTVEPLVSDLLRDNDGPISRVESFSDVYTYCKKIFNQLPTGRVNMFRLMKRIDQSIFGKYLKNYPAEEMLWLNNRLQADADSAISSTAAALWIDETKSSINRLVQVFESGPETGQQRSDDIGAEALLEKLTTQIYTNLNKDMKSSPVHWEIIAEVNNVVHILKQYLTKTIKMLVAKSHMKASTAERLENLKMGYLGELESHVNTCIAGLIDAMMNRVKSKLADQRKTDFKDLDEISFDSEVGIPGTSPTWHGVCQILNTERQAYSKVLDGQNLRIIEQEIALYFLSVLYEHMSKFEYGMAGGMLMLKDVTEYKRFVIDQLAPNSGLARKLFSILQGLINLVVVVPDNLTVLAQEQRDQNHLSEKMIQTFVNLRSDKKSKRQDWIHRVVGML